MREFRRRLIRAARRVVLSGPMLRLLPELRRTLSRDAVPFAGVDVPEDVLRASFLTINGGTGAGKSLTLSTILAARVPKIRPGSRRRLIYYDFKNEHVRIIAAIKPEVPIRLLLPSDVRCSPWHIARDLAGDSKRIRQFTTNCVPDVKGEQNPFFTKATRAIFEGVVLALDESCPGAWTLADAVRILASEHWTREMIGRCPRARSKLRFMKNPDAWSNIEATVETALAPLRIIAAYWLHAKADPISVDDFIDGEVVYLLGNDPGLGDVAFMNDLFLKFVNEELLLRPDGTSGETMVVVDEATTLNGDSPSRFLRDAAQRGRSRGMDLTLVYQSYGDWLAIYDKFAAGILGQFRSQIHLGTGDAETAAHNSQVMGRERGWERQTSVTRSLQGDSATEQYVWFDRELVPYSEFLRIPPSTPEDGIHGRACNPTLGAWQFHVPGETVARIAAWPEPGVPAYDPRPKWQADLPPFRDLDLARLGLTPDPDDGAGLGPVPPYDLDDA